MINPYDPQVATKDTADPGVYGNVAAFMQNPGVQASLLSAGLQLAQPPQFGQNGLAHIASAIGAGGESAQLQNKQRMAEEEAASKQDLRSAQADTAQARAQTAGASNDASAARLEVARGRLGLDQQKADFDRANRSLGQQIKIGQMYQNYLQKTAEMNRKGSLFDPKFVAAPTQSRAEFVKNLELQGMLPEGGGGSDVSSPTATTSTPGDYPTPTAADKAYLAANPGVKSRFEQKFGPGPYP